MSKRQMISVLCYCVIVSFVFVGLFQDYPSCLAKDFYIPWAFCASAIGFYAGHWQEHYSGPSADDLDQDGMALGFFGFWLNGLIGFIAGLITSAIGWTLGHIFFVNFGSRWFGMTEYMACLNSINP